MPAPPIIQELVDRFTSNKEAYRSPAYNETQLRREFLDPFFEALGWDVFNRQGYAEAYKDVIHEDAIRIGSATKAPDYCFRIGGARKFFVEAKKPSVNVRDDPSPAYQLRRYAWSARLPLSVLTDFEEFAVYDCRINPDKNDSAGVGRILYITFDQYPTRWDEIADVFSREAILKGSFDKFAESRKGKRGTVPVGVKLLEQIESWRALLARNLALRNPAITQRELNFAVQRTIDRIIFLRMCEDRGIEPYGQLLGVTSGPRIYASLRHFFWLADDRYNSGLFHFHADPERAEPPDELTPSLEIDDKVLKEIITHLYYPDSPYEFSVLPPEILGQVYEQFLGKVIRLTAGHQAKVEEKPEVRKAGGIYYTPAYIVDYIVKHTVGKLLEEKTPKQAAKLRILDPACGSGSFLVGAYQYLLDWHRDWYVADGPEKHRKEIYQGRGGQWLLTSNEKRRILLNNICGVDIDPQAVEVTKLSLLLKVLENENQETISRQLSFARQRALPDLGRNIKCGNSLIGPDIYQDRPPEDFTDEDRTRINAFDWNAEFPEIMNAGGFDAVIGNPPWGQKEIAEEQGIKEYVWKTYPSSVGIYDQFRPFVEQGIRLLRSRGVFGFVLPDIVLLKDYIETREYLLCNLAFTEIDWWGMAFADAVIDSATIIGTKGQPEHDQTVRVAVHDPDSPKSHHLKQADFWENPRLVFNLHLTPEKRDLVRRLEAFPKLGDYYEVHEGVHSGNIRAELFVDKRLDKTCKPLIFGRGELQPYLLRWEGKWVRLGVIPDRRTKHRYANAGNPEWYEREKLLVRRTGDRVLAAVDRECRYASNNFFIVFPKQPCPLTLDGLCAILNSKFMTTFFRTIEPRQGRAFAELKIKHLSMFPLPLDLQRPQTCKPLNALGAARVKAAMAAAQARTPHEIAANQRTIQNLDVRIDSEVERLMQLAHRRNVTLQEA